MIKEDEANTHDVAAHSDASETDNAELIARLPKPVYCIEILNTEAVLVGIDVTVRYEKNSGRNVYLVSWWDTTPRDHSIVASEMKRDGEVFTFRRLNKKGGEGENNGSGKFFRFTPMTLEIYNSKVKRWINSNGRDFASEEDLIKAFLDTQKSAW